MLPGMNERQMKQMMRQLGINPVEIAAKEVVIKTDSKEIVISNPQVSKVNMMGQETWQIVGKAIERAPQNHTTHEISSDDIETVASQANVSKEEAKAALEKHKGDLAAAILELSQE